MKGRNLKAEKCGNKTWMCCEGRKREIKRDILYGLGIELALEMAGNGRK